MNQSNTSNWEYRRHPFAYTLLLRVLRHPFKLDTQEYNDPPYSFPSLMRYIQMPSTCPGTPITQWVQATSGEQINPLIQRSHVKFTHTSMCSWHEGFDLALFALLCCHEFEYESPSGWGCFSHKSLIVKQSLGQHSNSKSMILKTHISRDESLWCAFLGSSRVKSVWSCDSKENPVFILQVWKRWGDYDWMDN